MRLPFRAAVAAPLVAALALAACAGEGGDDAAEPGEGDSVAESVVDDPSGAETGSEEPVELPEPTDLGEGVAATVAGEEITVAELEEAVAPRGVDDLEADPETVRLSLQQLVQVELVELQAASELGIDVDTVLSDEAIQAQVDEFVADAGGVEAFEAALVAQGVAAEDALAVAEQDARIQVLIDAITDALVDELPDDAVDEEALRAEYEADPSAYQSSDVAHILFTDEGAAEGEEPDYPALEDEADVALERLDDGEDFGELAVELSEGPSGPSGGELGVNPRGSYVEPFSEAVYADSTTPGEVVGPVRTQFGVHLILVHDIIMPSVEEVVDDARRQAAGAQLQEFATAAFEAREVVVDDDFGVWNRASATVEPA